MILLIGLAEGIGLAQGPSDELLRITPFGDTCPKCGIYGKCDKQLRYEEAVIAINSYFKDKGLDISVVKQRRRFIIADVYRNGEWVDRVLFDRKTGRVRSVY